MPRFAAGAAVMVVVLMPSVSVGRSAAADKDLATLLPDGLGPAEWQPAGDRSAFDADNLYDLLDGGAAVYVEYGIVRAATREYTRGDEAVVCTVYQMRDPDAAFGIFSYGRSVDRAPIDIGDGGIEADLQLAFWQDRYFVTIEATAPGQALRDAAQRFGASISQRIADHARRPVLLDRLRPFGVAADTEKLLSGHIAAGNLLFIGKGDLFQLGAGEHIVYGERGSGDRATKIFVAVYQQPGKAGRVHVDAQKTLAAGGFQRSGESPGAFFSKDNRFLALTAGADSMLVVESGSLPSVRETIAAASR